MQTSLHLKTTYWQKKLKQLQLSTEIKEPPAESNTPTLLARAPPDLSVTSKLLKTPAESTESSAPSDAVERSIRQAPLLSAGVVAEHYKDLVPQYGLISSLEEADDTSPDSQLFLNTNVPFSAFICGVQGSGKSHTTSCILESAILTSSHLGHLESPLSTLSSAMANGAAAVQASTSVKLLSSAHRIQSFQITT